MKIFVTVYQHSSVTKAAGKLHLAQPSVSLAVKELEEYYGIRLFERIGRGISPTEAGSEFYSYALHIVSLFEDMEKKIKNWDTLGTIRIGTSITIGTHILPSLIKSYQEEFPSLRVEAVVNNSGLIEQYVLDNTIDLGLIETQPEHAEIQAVPFMEDQLCAILSSSGRPKLRDPFPNGCVPFPYAGKRKRRKGDPGSQLFSPAPFCPAYLGKLQHPGHCQRCFPGTGSGGPPLSSGRKRRPGKPGKSPALQKSPLPGPEYHLSQK